MLRATEGGGGGDRNKSWGTVAEWSQSLVSSVLVSLLLQLSKIWHWIQEQVSGGNSNLVESSGEEVETASPTVTMSEQVILDQEQQDEQVVVGKLEVALRLNSESLDEEEEELMLELQQDPKAALKGEDSCSGYCSGSGCSLPGSPTPVKDDEEAEEELTARREDIPASEKEICRRDSDTSDSSCDVEVSQDVAERVVTQVESMFSDEHLAKDGFLLKHVRRRSDGYVSLKLVAGLRKVKQISREFPVVLASLRKSDKLEVNGEGTKVRRKDPLTPELKSMPVKQAKKEKSQSQQQQAEKENRQVGSNATTAVVDEQSVRRKKRSDRLNELQSDRRSFTGRLSCDESVNQQSSRPRGGSLPIPPARTYRTGGSFLCPGSSPPSGFLRPKSNSYSEGTESSASACSWLQRRKASSRMSNGDINLGGVIRQPRGPDGTTGFHLGHRSIIVQERLQREMASTISAFAS